MNDITKRLIQTNPLRVLGVYVGESKAKEAGNINRISAHAKVGQIAQFALRGDSVLQPLNRDEKMVAQAIQALSLPLERLKYSIFWYAGSQCACSEQLNAAIDALIADKIGVALYHYNTLINSDQLREEFVDKASFGLLTLDKQRFAELFTELISPYINSIEQLITDKCTAGEDSIQSAIFDQVWSDKLEEGLKRGFTNDDNIYVQIEDFEQRATNLIQYVKLAYQFWGPQSYRYKDAAYKIISKIYQRGTYIMRHIKTFVDNGVSNTTIRASQRLLTRVHTYVVSLLADIQMDTLLDNIIKADRQTFNDSYNTLTLQMEQIAAHNWHIRFLLFLLALGVLALILIENTAH